MSSSSNTAGEPKREPTGEELRVALRDPVLAVEAWRCMALPRSHSRRCGDSGMRADSLQATDPSDESISASNDSRANPAQLIVPRPREHLRFSSGCTP